MYPRNTIEYVVYADYGLFSDPITRVGGEKFSCQIPTYQAIKGITESIYWKPSFIWYIDEVRVMNQIRTESKGIRPLKMDGSKSKSKRSIKMNGGNSLSYYTYLRDVRYQVRAHFEWNYNRLELAQDRIEDKHYNIAKRMVEKGGRRDIFLGTRECQGYIERCEFGSGKGFYDNSGIFNFGIQFHGFNYPDETGTDELGVRFWNAEMTNGRILYPKPDECKIINSIHSMKKKQFTPNINYNMFESGDIE